MYKIIGADQKEYGPVSAAEIREWIAEGRANGQTLAQGPGAIDWKPLHLYSEFSDVLNPAPPPGLGAPVSPGSFAPLPLADVVDRDYYVDIGNCIKRSWELVKANLLPVVGISLLSFAIPAIINQLIGLTSSPATQALMKYFLGHLLNQTSPETAPPQISVGLLLLIPFTWLLSMCVSEIFMGGLYNYYLKLIRGQNAEIGDAFVGVTQVPGQLALLGLIKGILAMIAFAFCLVPGIYLSIAWIFSTVLVVDRRLGFWDSMEISRQVVTRHWFTIFALVIVNGVISLAGIFACFIGALVTLPIALISLMYAYEDIFTSRGT
ncbi:GYF domain-containing protein [Pedosphaera parvula]|uniref:GYF domain-containing protein n=1 Tax=Pedosphaera parvula (strain Ellin514) TaxID=320771 RepID=B9XNQ8_PEDPL|nr:GYF domain-containing protein [Pedosphaera parvula]EEF58481.1 hypothetical protein Cflav_PD1208 [Pedosphaera parvula Ellin514]